MNTYAIYFKDSRESLGPCQIIIRDVFRVINGIPRNFTIEPWTKVAVVDPNGAVLLANMMIKSIEIEKGDVYIKLMEYEPYSYNPRTDL